MDWDGKAYHSLDWELKKTYGEKAYKLSLDIGCTCPNRDGTIGTRGCIFCSAGGSGDFAVGNRLKSMHDQIAEAKARIRAKTDAHKFIAYFQSYTNTYGDRDFIFSQFEAALNEPDIVALSIGTRPDCIDEWWIEKLSLLNKCKPVWVELGLQTIHESTAELIRRGYSLPVFDETYKSLKASGLAVIIHVILGLPGESKCMMTETVKYISSLSPLPDGIKLHLLHILKGTDLAELHAESPVPTFTMDEYVDYVVDLISQIPPEITIHRITGDGPKNLLIAPLWSADKKAVLNLFTKVFREKGVWQGKNINKNTVNKIDS